jgi:hypothetical protein
MLASAGGGPSLLGSLSDFLRSRSGDFVRLEDTAERYGTGPVLALRGVPEGIDDDEIRDMVEDGCASASAPAGAPAAAVVVVCRLRGNSPLLDLPLQEALEAILDRGRRQARGGSARAASAVVVVESGDATTVSASPEEGEDDEAVVPVLLFSGFRDDEMRSVYGLLGREINAEARSISGGAFQQSSASVAACAKAVPNAMSKPLRRVLSEVAGDHRDAAGLLPGEKDGTAR